MPKKPQPTHPEARAACRRVLEEMFDLPGVLRGKKKLTDLAGLGPMSCWAVCIGLSMVIQVMMQNMQRKVVGSLYLRDIRVFLRDLGRQMAISLMSVCVQSMTSWSRMRITYAWQAQLQDKLHATYFKESLFYRQTTWPDAIPDPGQRITRDISVLSFELRMFCTSSINDSLASVQSIFRVWTLMPDQRYMVPFVICWTYANLAFRNYFSPALERGMVMAIANGRHCQ